jgi:hypothetical protein
MVFFVILLNKSLQLIKNEVRRSLPQASKNNIGYNKIASVTWLNRKIDGERENRGQEFRNG